MAPGIAADRQTGSRVDEFQPALAHPAFGPLRCWLDRLDVFPPDACGLNALAAASPQPPVTSSGRPVQFCAPGRTPCRHYEQRVFETGQVETRPGNLHDLFNALAWLSFPRLKAALNARHVERLQREGPLRGPLRDLLTLVDEGGVIVACANESLASLERGFQWKELYWDRRDVLARDLRFVLAGHSAYEKALAPHPGITCKALFVATPRARLEAPCADLVAWLDGRAAEWLCALPASAAPREMPPLPVFGYPGWLAASNRPEFYADERWFRPARRTASRKLELEA